MTNLIPESSFSDVYQIETSDPVLGGPGGIANRQPQQLANRDEWLKSQIEEIQNDPVLSALATLIVNAADKMIYSTGENDFALSTITAFARSLLDDANASAALSTLGVSGFIKTLLDDATAEVARGTLGVPNDSDVVHKAGSEDVSGHKTFKDKVSFESGVFPQIPPLNADVSSNEYPDGLTVMSVASSVTGWPTATGTALTSITTRGGGQRIFQLYVDKTIEGIWFRTRNGDDTAWYDFEKLATTAFVQTALTALGAVLLTGNQTIDGVKTFSSVVKLCDSGFVFASDGQQDTGLSWGGDGVINIRSDNQTIGTLDAYKTRALSASGYQKLPSGLILQWGETAVTGSFGDFPITFPITFPNAVLRVIPSINGHTETQPDTTSAYNITTSGFTMRATLDSPPLTGVYMAIGY